MEAPSNGKERWPRPPPKGKIQSRKSRLVGREKEEDELRRGRRGYLYPRDSGRKVIKDGRITAAVTGDIHGVVLSNSTAKRMQ